MTALPASLSHVEMSFTFSRYPVRLPYNIQRPFFFFLTDCLLGFFSVNVILLQTSLWKCHLATLFISSPALSSIIHHFPLDGSHTQGWSSSRAARTEVWLWEWRDGCSGCPDARVFFGLMFAQPWSPVIEDSLPLPTLHRCRGVECCQSCLLEEESCNFGVFASFKLKFWRFFGLCFLTSAAPGDLKSAEKAKYFLPGKIYLGHKQSKVVVSLYKHTNYKSTIQIT